MKTKRYNVLRICSVIVVIFIIMIITTKNRFMAMDDYLNNDTNVKVVALWTPFFNIKYWGLGSKTVGKKWLHSNNCPRTDCVFTNDKNLLDGPNLYDAIVFHRSENYDLLQLPEIRRASQLYVVATME